MTIGVLVVDDSNFFRQQISKLINSFGDFKVVGTAVNGSEAITKTALLRPDVITMDYEMPGMDGITSIRQIMEKTPTPILMLSSLSYDGARITLDALDSGATDYLLKDFESFARATTKTQNELYKKLKALSESPLSRASRAASSTPTPAIPNPTPAKPISTSKRENDSSSKLAQTTASSAASKTEQKNNAAANTAEQKNTGSKLKSLSHYDVMLIGCSTGGPAVLNRILSLVSANFPLPIVIALHMPEYFTETFAQRLNQLSKLKVKEAETGDTLVRGQVLLAPGGKQLIFDPKTRNSLVVVPNSKNLNYAPCVDVLFASAARDLDKKVLALVLTGMGADGREGAKLIKKNGATIWVQDEKSCVVFGMPGAIVKANLADAVLSMDALTDLFVTG